MYTDMGNHWALCTTWFPLCFPSFSQQQNCFYSRHPGFHQRVRLAGKKYNGSSPNWPHRLIHNRPWTLFFNPCPGCKEDAWGKYNSCGRCPVIYIKFPKCQIGIWWNVSFFPFSLTLSQRTSQRRLSREGWTDDELGEICTIDHSDRI